jgi:hypothetical protein
MLTLIRGDRGFDVLIGLRSVLGLRLTFGLGHCQAEQCLAQLANVQRIAANTAYRKAAFLIPRMTISVPPPFQSHQVTSFRQCCLLAALIYLYLLLILGSTSTMFVDFTTPKTCDGR